MEKKVSAGVIIFNGGPQKLLEPKTLDIKFSLRTEAEDSDNLMQSQIDHNISYAKIRLFLESVLPNTIICGSNDLPDCINLTADMDNNLMVLPDCGESILAAAMHQKLNSMCKEYTYMEEIVIYDPAQEITYRYQLTDDEFDISLPGGQWLGELSFWDDPWWERDDALTFDNVASNKKELAKFTEDKGIHEYNSREVFAQLEVDIAKMFIDPESLQDEAVDNRDADIIRVDFGKG
jgi:hypothetical protein